MQQKMNTVQHKERMFQFSHGQIKLKAIYRIKTDSYLNCVSVEGDAQLALAFK